MSICSDAKIDEVFNSLQPNDNFNILNSKGNIPISPKNQTIGSNAFKSVVFQSNNTQERLSSTMRGCETNRVIDEDSP